MTVKKMIVLLIFQIFRLGEFNAGSISFFEETLSVEFGLEILNIFVF